jgi:hypothetical protein
LYSAQRITNHSRENRVFGWFRRRRLNDDARRRLVIALARAEDELIETHVQNALDVITAVGDALPLDKVLDVYLEAMEPGATRSTLIARRVLASLEDSDRTRSRGARRLRELLDED